MNCTPGSVEPVAAKPLFCFGFPVDDGDHAWVDFVFSASNEEAAAEVAGQHGVDVESVGLTHYADFDQYSPGPVPAKALLDYGWTVSCAHCEHHIIGGDGCYECIADAADNVDAADIGPVCDGKQAYCNATCRGTELAYRERIRQRKLDIREMLLKKFPFVEPTSAWVGSGGSGDCGCYKSDHENVCIHFRVPGGGLSDRSNSDGGSHNYFCFGCQQAWVARGDGEAFREWRSGKRTLQPDLIVSG